VLQEERRHQLRQDPEVLTEEDDETEEEGNGRDVLGEMEIAARIMITGGDGSLWSGGQVVETFYRWFAETERMVTLYSQGINQTSSGTDKVNAIINCHLLTGRIGRPGSGPFSVTGQPNAMGGREVGALANQLACHMELENAEHRELVGRFRQAPNLAARPGLKRAAPGCLPTVVSTPQTARPGCCRLRRVHPLHCSVSPIHWCRIPGVSAISGIP
jgi:hypothetical protein